MLLFHPIFFSPSPQVYPNLRHAVATMWRSEGPLTFYRGLSPTLVAVFPYAGLQFFSYNVFKQLLAPPSTSGNSGGGRSFTSAARPSSMFSEWCWAALSVSPSTPSRKPEELPVRRRRRDDQQNHHVPLWPFQEEAAGWGLRSGTSSLWTGTNRLGRLACSRPAGLLLYVSSPSTVWHRQVRHYKGLMDCAIQIAREEGVRGYFKGLSPSLVKAALSTGFTFFWYEFFLNAIRQLRNDNRGKTRHWGFCPFLLHIS